MTRIEIERRTYAADGALLSCATWVADLIAVHTHAIVTCTSLTGTGWLHVGEHVSPDGSRMVTTWHPVDRIEP